MQFAASEAMEFVLHAVFYWNASNVFSASLRLIKNTYIHDCKLYYQRVRHKKLSSGGSAATPGVNSAVYLKWLLQNSSRNPAVLRLVDHLALTWGSTDPVSSPEKRFILWNRDKSW